MDAMSELDPSDFEHVSRIVHDDAGIVIDETKSYLVQDRLRGVARGRGLDCVKSLVAALRQPDSRELRECVVDAMTTNETFFFRDEVPFTTLAEQVLPWLLRERAQRARLSIWCAAASTGQEPYSLAMSLVENVPRLSAWNVHLLATDLSPTALERARAGVYTDFEIGRGLDPARRDRFFRADGRRYAVHEKLKRLIDFQRFNLLNAESQEGPFDIVFLRNVLIYFDVATKTRILKGVARALGPNGLVVLGAGESILQLGVDLERIAKLPGAYYGRRGHPLA